MVDNVVVVPLDRLQDTIGKECNPFLTAFSFNKTSDDSHGFMVTSMPDGEPHNRVLSAIDYLVFLRELADSADRTDPHNADFIFQAEDMPVDVPSVSWEAMNGWNHTAIIPDLYYFHARGYEEFHPPMIEWRDRAPVFVWRGSTTGRFYQLADDLGLLPRYRLCDRLARLGAVADVGFTAAVQAADLEHEIRISERLIAEGLLKPFIEMQDMTRYRYILDIDGNSNSWNFIMKLRLGCCVLRVDSDWRQWFSSRLTPWVHYVPVAKDISDLEEKIDWCLANDAKAMAIAERGAAFARTMVFNDEMMDAAMITYGPLRTA